MSLSTLMSTVLAHMPPPPESTYNPLVNSPTSNPSIIPPKSSTIPSSILAPVDVYETNSHKIIIMNVPGLTKDQLHIRVENGRLHISGEFLSSDNEVKYLHNQRPCGKFEKSIAMPLGSTFKDVLSPTLNNGVLRISIFKCNSNHSIEIE